MGESRKVCSRGGFKTRPYRTWRDSLGAGLLALALYGATLSPTVLWGDSGHLQLQAVRGTLQSSAGSHPLWVAIAHLFSKIPIGDVAARINAVSAVFGALTISILYLILRELSLPRVMSFLAVLALGISHTFWTYAVCAEVYTLTLAIMALLIWLGLRWYHSGRRAYLIWLGLTAALGLTAHLLVVLYAPALLWLAWRGRARLDACGILSFALAFLVGLLPLVGLILLDAQALGLHSTEIIRRTLFSFEEYDFGRALFDFSWRFLSQDLTSWGTFLALQFLGPALLCGFVGMVNIWRTAEPTIGVFTLLLYLGDFFFAFSYRVGDQYVFYLPSYLPFTIWIGFGLAWIWRPSPGLKSWAKVSKSPSGTKIQPPRPWRTRRGAEGLYRHERGTLPLRVRPKGRSTFRWVVGLALLMLALPLATYLLSPELVARNITIRDTRRVPGPQSKYFFLWPPKTHYQDARAFAEATLEALPRDAVLLADSILLEPVRFLQETEHVRPDVTLRYCCWDIAQALEEAGDRPVALGALAPSIYPIKTLGGKYTLHACGPVYCLSPRGER